MRVSRVFRPEDGPTEDAVPVRRTLFWIVVWIAILFGIGLFFRYAHFLAPLLD